MPDITIEMKDGTKREFRERGRAGGSYTNSIRYEVGFVVIQDEWGGETSIPSAEIKEIRKSAPPSSW